MGFALLLPPYFWAWVVAIVPGEKQFSQYTQKNWSYEEGLPQVTVMCLFQDSRGYLWMGTQEGLVRFDGRTMEIFDRPKYPDLLSDFVLSIYQRENERIWVGTRRGAFLLERGRPQIFAPEQGMPDTSFSCFASPPSGETIEGEPISGEILAGTNEGLYLFDGTFRRLENLASLNNTQINQLYTDRHGKLWIGTQDGLYVVRHWGGQPERLLEHRVTALYGEADQLWVGTLAGFQRFELGMEEQTRLEIDTVVQGMARDEEGHLWLAGSTGIYRGSADGPFVAQTPFPHNAIAMLADRESNLWIGTQVNGLHMIHNGPMRTFGETEGIPPFSIRSIIQARDRSLWMGSNGGVIQKSEAGIRLYDISSGLADKDVKCIFQDRSGSIWVGTNFGGVYLINEGVVRHLKGFQGTTVRVFCEDIRGRILVGGLGGGLGIFHNGRWSHLGRKDGLPSENIYAIHADGEYIWLGFRSGGVALLKDNEIQPIEDPKLFQHASVFGITGHKNGTVWFGTEQGLGRYKRGRFSLITPAQGLGDSLIYKVIDDGNGGLWMSCNKGIFYAEKEALDAVADGRADRLTSRFFNQADGMRSPECNFGGTGSGLRDYRGKLWFPTIEGVVYLDPTTAAEKLALQPPTIEFVRSQNTQLTELPSKFPPDLHRLEVHYNALLLSAPERLKFQLFLEGLDDQWTDAGERRTAYFTSLPARSYRLRIRVAGPDQVWREAEPWSFEVAPYFYQRNSFRALTLLLAIAGIWLLHTLRLKQHIKREQLLEKMVSSRTGELMEANKRLLRTREDLVKTAHLAGRAEVANNVVHNLGNALNSANVSASMLRQEVEHLKASLLMRLVTLLRTEAKDPDFIKNKGDDVLSALNRVAQHMNLTRTRLIDQISDLQQQLEHQNDIIRVQQNEAYHGEGFEEAVDLTELLNEVLSYGGAPLGMELQTEFEQLPRLLLQRGRLSHVLFHLINNAWEALAGVSGPKVLTLKTRREIDEIHIEFEDQGTGIPPENLQSIFFQGFTTKAKHDGFGLHFCANSMREMKGSLEVTSDGPGQGTRVLVRLPFKPAS